MGKTSKITLLIFTLLAICMLACACSKNEGVTVTETSNGGRKIQTTNNLEDTAHIGETICSNTELEAVLFEIPFQTNQDAYYVSNVVLISYFEDSGKRGNVSQYLKTAEKAALLTYAQNYNTLNKKDYTEGIETLYSASEYIQILDETYSIEEYASYLYDFYKENKINITGEFTTDESLIWCNNYMYYVRGTLTLTLNEDALSAYSKEFGLPLTKENNELKLIVQVRFVPEKPEQIVGIDILCSI